MGKTKRHPPVKLVIGLIFYRDNILQKTQSLLSRRFGKIDFQSPQIPFGYTDYYKKEFGDNLIRQFISFKKLIDPEKLAEIKILTNKIEKKFSRSGCRMINIDPGYIDLSKLVLATTKDYSHRIYLKQGIYAEVTLTYRDKGFKALAWTYPDYGTAGYTRIFDQIREIYAQEINGQNG